MAGKTRAFLLSLTIIAVIIFSAFGTTTVYADGETPPDTPPPTEAGPPPDAATDTVADPADSAQPTKATANEPKGSEAAPPSETPLPPPDAAADTAASPEVTASPADAIANDSTVSEAAPVEDAASADASLLSAVPEDTAVAVVDASGETEPLATQAAADAISQSDPMWCPGSQAPGTTGCTGSFSSFDALLTFLEANPSFQGAGTIYVEQGTYNGGETTIDFNAYDLGSISNADLTVTGGWNTTSNVLNPENPSTFNGIPITIGSSTTRWGGSLTVSNITIRDTAGTGLTLFAQNNITVSNVDVTNSTNGSGAELDAGGDVNINNSNFIRNKQAGANIHAGRNVAIANSSFSNPANARRQSTGLAIVAIGSVSLFDVLANENRLAGADITTSGAVSIGGIPVTGGSFFSGTREIRGTNFLGYGLKVTTPSTISIDSVTANNNFLWGASLDSGSIISISNSIFNGNTTASPGFIDDTGLFITRATDVSLNNVRANDNRLYGAQILASGNVSVNDSFFNNNRGIITTGGATTFHGHGLQVTSTGGNITVSGTEATNNMLFGAQLNAAGNVDIAGGTFSNNSTNNPANAVGKGLEIISGGNVTLTTVLDSNQTDGATIQAVGNVFLDGVTATNNGSNGVLVVQANCTQVIGGAYTGNGQRGLNLAGSPLDLVSPPTGDIFPANPTTCVLGPVTLPVTLNGTSVPGTTDVFASLQTESLSGGTAALEQNSNTDTGNSSGSITLKKVLAKTVARGQFGIFVGKYAAVYADSGMQIIAFSPTLGDLALH